MRHVTGVLLAIVLGAAVFFLGGWGLNNIVPLSTRLTNSPSTRSVEALAALIVLGVLLGVLLTVRAVSPLATGLPGIAALVWTGILAADPHRGLTLIHLTGSSYGPGVTELLTRGVLGLIGAAMVIPLFMPSRWRRYGDPAGAAYNSTSSLLS